MKKVLTLLVMLMIVMSNTACASSQERFCIEGKVVDAAGKPQPGIKL